MAQTSHRVTRSIQIHPGRDRVPVPRAASANTWEACALLTWCYSLRAIFILLQHIGRDNHLVGAALTLVAGVFPQLVIRIFDVAAPKSGGDGPGARVHGRV